MFQISDQTLAIWMLENRTRGLRMRDMLRRNAKRYVALFIIEGSAIALLAFLDFVDLFPIKVAPLAVAFVFGAVVRDVAWFDVNRRLWPFKDRTTDWNEIQRIADGVAP